MSLISVNNLTFYYEGSYDNIFEDVRFQIDTDWKLGFVARNGRGKTTFLNLLLGKEEYRGNITANVEFDYFPFPVENKEETTLQLVEKLYPDYEFWRICAELTRLHVDNDVFYRPFYTLSNGEQTKVMLAVLFSRENNFLLIDEPTNHLDMPTREVVKEYLKSKKGFILVSHDRDFLDDCVDHILAINKTNIEVCQGNFSTWWENKMRQDEYERSENERLKKDIKRLTESARRTEQWADNVEATKIGKKSEKYEKCIDTRAYVGEKSRRMQMRRKNLERRQEREIEEKSSLLKNVETAEKLKLFPLRHYKEVLVSAKDVKVLYPEKEIAIPDFTIKNGDRVVLAGPNGCGKTSIIRALLGQAGYTGMLQVAAGLKISYVPQDAEFLKGSLDAYIEKTQLDASLFKVLLRKLDFDRLQFEKNMEDYSGGQKKKVLLAESLCTQAHLYIWDEPLNFIDVFSRIQIEELILQFRPTLLMVEHDKTFVERTATHVVSLASESIR